MSHLQLQSGYEPLQHSFGATSAKEQLSNVKPSLSSTRQGLATSADLNISQVFRYDKQKAAPTEVGAARVYEGFPLKRSYHQP